MFRMYVVRTRRTQLKQYTSMRESVDLRVRHTVRIHTIVELPLLENVYRRIDAHSCEERH